MSKISWDIPQYQYHKKKAMNVEWANLSTDKLIKANAILINENKI